MGYDKYQFHKALIKTDKKNMYKKTDKAIKLTRLILMFKTM